MGIRASALMGVPTAIQLVARWIPRDATLTVPGIILKLAVEVRR